VREMGSWCLQNLLPLVFGWVKGTALKIPVPKRNIDVKLIMDLLRGDPEGIKIISFMTKITYPTYLMHK